MTACPVWPWLSPYNVCVTFAPPPWSLADLTGSHDDSILLPIDEWWWWGLPLVFMLTANITGAAVENWKTIFQTITRSRSKYRSIDVFLYTVLSQTERKVSVTVTCVDTSFLFVLQQWCRTRPHGAQIQDASRCGPVLTFIELSKYLHYFDMNSLIWKDYKLFLK